MTDLARVQELAARELGLATVVTLRPDGSAHCSVVNAGVLSHPTDGRPVVGFAVRGARKKLAHIRNDPRVSVVFRAGWDWIAVDGTAETFGPDQRIAGVSPSRLQLLRREVYAAAIGGTSSEWSGVDEAAGDPGQSQVQRNRDEFGRSAISFSRGMMKGVFAGPQSVLNSSRTGEQRCETVSNEIPGHSRFRRVFAGQRGAVN
jgi:hypothetical protein